MSSIFLLVSPEINQISSSICCQDIKSLYFISKKSSYHLQSSQSYKSIQYSFIVLKIVVFLYQKGSVFHFLKGAIVK